MIEEDEIEYHQIGNEQKIGTWKYCSYACWAIVALLAALVVLGGGVGMPFYIDKKLKDGIREQVVVDSETAAGFKAWQNNTTPDSPPTYMKFYVWNVTNAQEVLTGAKPKLDEVGPFAYREYTVKLNVSFSEDGEKVTYNKWEYFVFDAAASCDRCKTPQETLVTVASVPFQSVIGGLLYGAQSQSEWWKALAFDVLADYANASFFDTLPAEKLFFGQEYEILKTVSTLQPGTPVTFGIEVNQTTPEEALKIPPSTQLTGKSHIIDIWNYTDYEGKGDNLGCWESPIANQIIGNDGLQWWPGIDKNSRPAAFVSDVFRMVWFIANNTFHFEGIELMHFSIPYWGALNASEVPWNANYDQFGRFGVQNLTHCEHGAPVFISKPHFLDADPWYLDRVEGISPPVEWDHDTILGVEHHTGATMYGRKRLQINVQVQQDVLLAPGVMKDLYFPVAWVEEGGDITPHLAGEFKGKVYFALKLQTIILWTGVSVGAALFLLFIGLGYKGYIVHQSKKEASNIPTLEPINE